MKQILVTAFAMVAISTSANAADNVVIEPGAAAYNWSGVYVGAAIGWASINYDELENDYFDRRDGSFAGAVYAGYNFQMNNVVLGIEGDLNFRNAEPEDNFTNPLNQNLGGSVRGRIGYAIDRFMPYMTAGVAIANFEADHDGDGADVAKKTMTGYSVGAGVEWAVTDNLIVRGQYLYSDFGTDEFDFVGTHTHEYDVRTHDVLLGVAYKF
jgi:outer membrane immunogenic protein